MNATASDLKTWDLREQASGLEFVADVNPKIGPQTGVMLRRAAEALRDVSALAARARDAERILRHGVRRLVDLGEHVDASLLESGANDLALAIAGVEPGEGS